MSQAKNGDTVKVHYTGKLEDGTVFDSSQGRDPLEFKLGDDRMIPGFETAIVGMNVGDEKTIKVRSDEAYGPHREELVFEVERESLPDDLDPQVGQQLELQQPDGRSLILTVADMSDSGVTLDGNHPLAGKDLTFDVTLVSVGQ